MNKVIKWLLIPLFIILVIYFAYNIYSFIVLDNLFDGTIYTKKDLIENYESKQKEIIELKTYFESILPEEKEVTIEFERRKLAIFHITDEHGKRDFNWNLKIKSKKVDSLNDILGWNQETLTELKSKLDKANCVSIEKKSQITIGFQRSGMGMYFYKLFDKKLNDSLISKYNDGCQYSYFNENVVLEYNGGAIGPQCFQDFRRK